MKEERHVIWSNYGLDYEDWRDGLEEGCPELSIPRQRQAAAMER